MELVLYSGQNCCLCAQALILLADMNIQVQKIDVRTSTELYHQYGARIPVLYRTDTQQELSWPFNSSQLCEFLV